MIRSFGPPYFLAALLTLLLSVLQFASPQIVNLLIDFVQVCIMIFKLKFNAQLAVILITLEYTPAFSNLLNILQPIKKPVYNVSKQ